MVEGTLKLEVLDIREFAETIETEPYGDEQQVLKIVIIGVGGELNSQKEIEQMGRYRFEISENSYPGKTARFLIPGDTILLDYKRCLVRNRIEVEQIEFDKDASPTPIVKTV